MKCFDEILNNMQRHNIPVPTNSVQINIPDAENILRQMFTYFVEKKGGKFEWLPEYSHIVDWLTDNKGRGLFLFGSCGRGKTLLCRYVLPAILLAYCNRVVSVFDTQTMNKSIDLALSKHLISLDDIGTEEIANTFGNKRMAFAEIMDAVEKQSKMIIVSTNLSYDEIRSRYGERVVERIRSTTYRVSFNGKSLRL